MSTANCSNDKKCNHSLTSKAIITVQQVSRNAIHITILQLYYNWTQNVKNVFIICLLAKLTNKSTVCHITLIYRRKEGLQTVFVRGPKVFSLIKKRDQELLFL